MRNVKRESKRSVTWRLVARSRWISIQAECHLVSREVITYLLRQARQFHALSSPVRMYLLTIICEHGEEGIAVGDLKTRTNLEQPTVSHHLRLMRNAGLVSYRQHGLYHHYYAVHETLQDVMESIIPLLGLLARESGRKTIC